MVNDWVLIILRTKIHHISWNILEYGVLLESELDSSIDKKACEYSLKEGRGAVSHILWLSWTSYSIHPPLIEDENILQLVILSKDVLRCNSWSTAVSLLSVIILLWNQQNYHKVINFLLALNTTWLPIYNQSLWQY